MENTNIAEAENNLLPVTEKEIKQPSKQKLGLKFILPIIGAILLILLTTLFVFVLNNNRRQNSSMQSSIAPAPLKPTSTPTPTQIPDIIQNGWGTRKETNYNIVFQYPTEMGTLKSELTKGDAYFPDEQHINFGDGFDASYANYVRLGKLDNYKNIAPKLADGLAKVFSSKRIDVNDRPLSFPVQSASLLNWTDLKYIESENGLLRGEYYFAQYTSGNPTDALTGFAAILTDNKGNVIEFNEQRGNGTDYNEIYVDYPCNKYTGNDVKKITCKLDKKILDDFNNFYKKILSTVSTITP